LRKKLGEELAGKNRKAERKRNKETKTTEIGSDTCIVCGKNVYFIDKIITGNKVWHKFCFKCIECNTVLALANYYTLDGKYYCKPHYNQISMSKGNYTKVTDESRS